MYEHRIQSSGLTLSGVVATCRAENGGTFDIDTRGGYIYAEPFRPVTGYFYSVAGH